MCLCVCASSFDLKPFPILSFASLAEKSLSSALLLKLRAASNENFYMCCPFLPIKLVITFWSLGFFRQTPAQHYDNTKLILSLCGFVLLFFLLISPDASHQPLISPAEVAVLESMMVGGRQLNLKAHFLTQLPDLCPLTTTLTYLNVSFNDLRVSVGSLGTWLMTRAHKNGRLE